MASAASLRDAPARQADDKKPMRPAPVNGGAHARDLEPAAARRDSAGAVGIERLCLARVLSEAVDHPDVEELYRRASLLDDRISIATVYRTVRLFEEKGILQRRDFGSGRARYEPADHGHHYHLIDVDSGKVVEFTSVEHERLVRAVAEQLGFDVVSMRLEVFGRRFEPRRGNGEAS